MKARELVGNEVRRWRVLRQMSQEQLAEAANVDRSFISEIERAASSPSIEILERLAAALGMHISWFFLRDDGGDDKPQNLKPGRKRAAIRTGVTQSDAEVARIPMQELSKGSGKE